MTSVGKVYEGRERYQASLIQADRELEQVTR
jgi:hypothetical protein